MQMVGVGERQRGEAAKHENIPDGRRAAVGHIFSDQNVNLRLDQMILRLVMLLFQFVVLKRIFSDPFVSQAVEYEIFQATQQIDRSVVFAPVFRLKIGVKPVEILIVDRREHNILFARHIRSVCGQVPKYAMIFVCRKLGYSHADLRLAFLAILVQFGKEHER